MCWEALYWLLKLLLQDVAEPTQINWLRPTMMNLLQGEGWAELLIAAIAVSVFGVWLVTVQSPRLGAPTFWKTWPSQQEPVAIERVAVTEPSAAPVDTRKALAARQPFFKTLSASRIRHGFGSFACRDSSRTTRSRASVTR